MMELMERKDAKEEWKLPKNIRQIGEPGKNARIFIEDYAYTYLRQLAESNLTCMKTAVLVGRVEDQGQICIHGALEIEMGQEQSKWFSHEHWRTVFDEVRIWFDGLEVVGWFLANPGFPAVLTEELRRIHRNHFSGSRYAFFQMDILENEEFFYIFGENGLTPAPGYYIYYEKNAQMQEYMSQKKGGAGIETEGVLRDRAATRFRSVMQEKKEQNTQKKTLAFLYTVSTFLVMVVLVIGVTMINNYDRMANMESAIHRISESLDEPSQEEIEAAAEAENQQAENLNISERMEEVKEEVPENVYEEPEEESKQEEVQPVISETVREPEQYRVKVGDTLLGICRSRYGDEHMVQNICELNGLKDSDKIYVGQTIVLP